MKMLITISVTLIAYSGYHFSNTCLFIFPNERRRINNQTICWFLLGCDCHTVFESLSPSDHNPYKRAPDKSYICSMLLYFK